MNKRGKTIRVDNEFFVPLLNSIKEEFLEQGITMTDTAATKKLAIDYLGIKPKKKNKFFEL